MNFDSHARKCAQVLKQLISLLKFIFLWLNNKLLIKVIVILA